MEQPKGRTGKSSSGMILRLRKSAPTSGKGSSHIRLLEPRKDHFRKTLLLAGALTAAAILVFFFTRANSVQTHGSADESAASAQSAQ